MKQVSKLLFSLLTIYFLLNNDLIITVQALSNERKLSSSLTAEKKGKYPRFKASINRSKKLKALTSNHWKSHIKGKFYYFIINIFFI